MDQPSLTLVLAAVGAWIAIGALGLVRPRNLAFVGHTLFPAGAAVGLALGDRRLLRDRSAAAVDGPAARAPRPSVPPARRLAVRVLPAAAGRRRRGDLAFLGGLFPLRRRHRPRAHLLPVPRLPRRDGDGADRRRRLPFHGRVGNDGAGLVLPRHHRSSDSRDPSRRISLPADRARRRDRDPALLRRAAGRKRRLHVRLDALGDPSRAAGPASRSSSRSSASARRPGSSRCTCGCRRRTRRRLRPSRR